MSAEPLAIAVEPATVEELRRRLGATRWPAQPEGGWDLGADLDEVRELCEWWAESYDFSRLERLTGLGSAISEGIHHLRAGERSEVPVILLHGWPSGPLEYEPVLTLLAGAGREAIVPSLPGYAWSPAVDPPLDVRGVAASLRRFLTEGLGITRYALAGGDFGAVIAARMAFEAPGEVAALYVSTPETVPAGGDLGTPALSPAETEFAAAAARWLRSGAHHLVIQGLAPDAISTALSDSPAGLAAYLLEKYRRWSDCDGDLSSRFPRELACDFLMMYWVTGSIGSSMRLYWAERRNRWRLEPGEAISVPAGVGSFVGASAINRPGHDHGLHPPREWTGRALPDLRQWRRHERGGHFAALEEPEAYTRDVLDLLEEAGV